MEIKELQEMAVKNAESLTGLTKSLDSLVDGLKKTKAIGHPDPSQVFGLPNARRGEDSMGSRGFSFLKMMGVATGLVQPENAKCEMDVSNRLHKCFEDSYEYFSKGKPGVDRFLSPLSTAFFHQDRVPNDFRAEMKSLCYASIAGADPNEANWISKRIGYGQKDLSWLNELSGGSLVAPPQQGELIELLRNKEALVNAGARVVPLPPQGRMKFPRQTMASTTYWVGENAPITTSDIGTGEITLQAKKLAVLIRTPSELVRFASPAAEALIRDDMTKSLALGLDLACLEGAGGDNQPQGLILKSGINTVASTDVRANGDALRAEDMYRMVAVIQESNAEPEGWIMRPKTLHKLYQLRSDAVAQGDKSGPFLFDLIRGLGDGVKPNVAGLPVTASTQISQVRAKGTSTALTYILCGMFSDALIGMFGAIEFAQTSVGDTAFTRDQLWVRGILSADFNVRHEAAFALLDSIDTAL